MAPGRLGRGEGAEVRPGVGSRAAHAAPRGAHSPRHGHPDGEVRSLARNMSSIRGSCNRSLLMLMVVQLGMIDSLGPIPKMFNFMTLC